MRRFLILRVVLGCVCVLVFSCGKEYIEEISKNIEPTVVDNAFRVDSLSVSDLKISTEEVSFIVKVHGNPMDKVTIAIQVNGIQKSYSMEQGRVVLRDLPPNTLCYLEVIVFLPSEINHLPVEPFSTTFATPNNRSNKDFFFQHRNFYYPLDHIQTLDQRFVFLSWGGFSEWINEGSNPYFPYKYKANFDLIKADGSGNVLWRIELPDIGINSADDRKGWLKEFPNGDLLIFSDLEVRKYSSSGQLIWSFSAHESSRYNEIADIEIMSNGSLYLVGRRVENNIEVAQIIHLAPDGTLLSNIQYREMSETVNSFSSVTSFGERVLYVTGSHGNKTKILRLNSLEIEWLKDIEYDVYIGFFTHKMKLGRSPDGQLHFSAFLKGDLSSHVLVTKLNSEGVIVAGKVIDDLYFGDVAFGKDGKVLITGSPLWGGLSSSTRLVSLNSDFSVKEDFYFQTIYGLTAGASVLALPNGGASIFGLAVGTQWHSIF